MRRAQASEAYWLSEGFHRFAAAREAELETIACEIRPGSLRDAILHSAGANATHGLRRSNADKRRAVLILIEDEEWSKWSDREISRQCAVSHEFVRKLRPDLSTLTDAPRTVSRGGNVYTMDTAAIGRRSAEAPADPAPNPARANEPSKAEPQAEATNVAASAKQAYDDLIRAAHRAQADAIEIEALAKRRLADEYDQAQDRGEVAGRGQPSNVPDQNIKATVTDLGLTRKAVHEARQVRNAEKASPGIVRKTLDALLDKGAEPTKAAVRAAVEAVTETSRSNIVPLGDRLRQAPDFAGLDRETEAQAAADAVRSELDTDFESVKGRAHAA